MAVKNNSVSKPNKATDIPNATMLRINKEPCCNAVSEIGKAKQVTPVPVKASKLGFTLLSQMIKPPSRTSLPCISTVSWSSATKKSICSPTVIICSNAIRNANVV